MRIRLNLLLCLSVLPNLEKETKMSEEKFTKWPWVADLRGGCCAVYPESNIDDTNGCHFDDERNIYYSSKGAKFNGNYWDMCEEARANAHLIAAAPELYNELKDIAENLLEHDNRVEVEKILAKARGEIET